MNDEALAHAERKRKLREYGFKLAYLGDNLYYVKDDDDYFSGTLSEWNQAAREMGFKIIGRGEK